MSNLFSPFIISVLASLALGYPAIFVAVRLNLIDIPNSAPHKTHRRPTPLAGGVFMVAIFAIMIFFYQQWLNREVLLTLIGAFVIFLFGLWDDFKGLSAGPKLIGQLIATTILISSGVQV